MKAGRAYIGEQNWEENVNRALPRLAEAGERLGIDKIQTVGDFVDLVHSAGRDLWNNVILPQTERWKNDLIDAQPAADAIRGLRAAGWWRQLPQMFGGKGDVIENLAKDLDGKKFTVRQLAGWKETLPNGDVVDHEGLIP
jgi:hypothetical protein